MTISESHAAHIRQVHIEFVIESPKLDPKMVTERIGLSPSGTGRKGEQRRNFKGDVVGVEENGWWQLSTKGIVASKDINDHFHFLLDRLLPHRESVLKFAEGGETYFGVRWESTYLYAGTGPLIDSKSISGVAALVAGMGFDIYQIDEPQDESVSETLNRN